MTNDPSIKKRLTRARAQAAEHLRGMGYDVIVLPRGDFDLIGIRPSDARFVRTCLGGKTPVDVAIVKRHSVPYNCSREIWERPVYGRDFSIESV